MFSVSHILFQYLSPPRPSLPAPPLLSHQIPAGHTLRRGTCRLHARAQNELSGDGEFLTHISRNKPPKRKQQQPQKKKARHSRSSRLYHKDIL